MQHSAVSESGLSLSLNIPWAFTVGQPVLVLLSSTPVLPACCLLKMTCRPLLSPTPSEVSDSRATRRGDRMAWSTSIHLVCLSKIQFPLLVQAFPPTLIHLFLLMSPGRVVSCCKHIICFSCFSCFQFFIPTAYFLLYSILPFQMGRLLACNSQKAQCRAVQG